MNFHYLVLISSLFLGSFASADNSLHINAPFVSVEGNLIEIAPLRARIRNIDTHLDDSDLQYILKVQPVSNQVISEVIGSCGHIAEFDEFFSSHQFLLYELDHSERLFLAECMRSVFRFADVNLGYAAPGLYKRFDSDYVNTGVELGYRCGYRSQQMFAYYSLSIWLMHPYDLQNHTKFRCLGDLSYSEGTYSEGTIQFGVEKISDELLFYQAAFGNWSDAMRYMEYTRLVSENRRREVCLYLANNPHDDPTLNRSLNLDNGCQDF
ncbi:MAG: hypothetical protein ABJH45_09360 [Paracoccaceae bacterium]